MNKPDPSTVSSQHYKVIELTRYSCFVASSVSRPQIVRTVVISNTCHYIVFGKKNEPHRQFFILTSSDAYDNDNAVLVNFYCRDSNRKTKIATAMDRSQHVCVGRRDITELRLRTSAIAHDQPNWCLHRPGHRKNGKRDVKEVPDPKSNSSSYWTCAVYDFST